MFELEISMSFTFELIKNNSVFVDGSFACKMEKLINSTREWLLYLMPFNCFLKILYFSLMNVSVWV